MPSTTITFTNRSGNEKTWTLRDWQRDPDGGVTFYRENREYHCAEGSSLYILNKRGNWSRLGRQVALES